MKFMVSAVKKIHLQVEVEADSASEAWAMVDEDYIVDDFNEVGVEFQLHPLALVKEGN